MPRLLELRTARTELRARVGEELLPPCGLGLRLSTRFLELLELPGLGPKLAGRLWRELRVGDLDQLEAALRSGEVAALPRLGEKTAENLIQQLEALRASQAASEEVTTSR